MTWRWDFALGALFALFLRAEVLLRVIRIRGVPGDFRVGLNQLLQGDVLIKASLPEGAVSTIEEVSA